MTNYSQASKNKLDLAAQAYYQGDYILGGELLRVCLESFNMITKMNHSLTVEQVKLVASKATVINAALERKDYVALADILRYELKQDVPYFYNLM